MDINIDVRNGKLRILFSRSLSKTIFGLNNRKSFSLGLKESPENRDLAQQIILEIKNDIRANKLVKDLKHYLPENRLKREIGIAYNPLTVKITLKELYTKWFEEKKVNEIRDNAGTYDIYVTRYLPVIEKCPQDLNDQEDIVDYIFANVDVNRAMRLCSSLHSMFNWAKSRKAGNIIPQEQVSYFKELFSEKKKIIPKFQPGKLINFLMPEYVHDYRIKAFTKVKTYLRPYNTRHTWINLQIQAGTNPLHICYTAGNTKEVMEMYYMSQPRPEDIVLKANVKIISQSF